MNVGSITTNNSIGYEYRKTQKAVSAQSFTDSIGILKYAMQQQYDLGNLAGYAKYKQFWDFLEQ